MGRFARKLRRQQTDAEAKLWYFLRDRRFSGLKFRRQRPIGPYVVDFCCLEKHLVIEADGGQHAERKVRDERRTRFLERKGYRVLRFWDNEILTETESVLEAIHNALEDPHPNPLPERERGVLLDGASEF